MKGKRLLITLLCIITPFSICMPALAGTTDSRALVRTRPGTGLDGRVIVFEGEAIQDVMVRTTHGWVNVRDAANAIGIWASAKDLKKIKLTGGYGRQGDRVRVTGVFHAACPVHGGDLDIHADRLEIVERGWIQRERVSTAYLFRGTPRTGPCLCHCRACKKKPQVSRYPTPDSVRICAGQEELVSILRRNWPMYTRKYCVSDSQPGPHTVLSNCLFVTTRP